MVGWLGSACVPTQFDALSFWLIMPAVDLIYFTLALVREGDCDFSLPNFSLPLLQQRGNHTAAYYCLVDRHCTFVLHQVSHHTALRAALKRELKQ